MSERDFTRSMTAEQFDDVLSELEPAIDRIVGIIEENDLPNNFRSAIWYAVNYMRDAITETR